MRPPLARESRCAPAITAESEPDADFAAKQLTIVVRKLPEPSLIVGFRFCSTGLQDLSRVLSGNFQ
eukprot:COSAG05_NODE_18_length_34957_cov_44.338115_13_plen_66_part_00